MSKGDAQRRGTRAQSGASLPLALLLFLICALLTSVVLAASTAEAGRHAKLSEMDQRYYSVVSALGVVQDAFSSQQVQIECVQEKDVTTVKTYREGSSEVGIETTEDVKSIVLRVRTGDGSWKAVMTATGADAAPLNTSGLTLPELNALNVYFGGEVPASATPGTVWDAAVFEDGFEADDSPSSGEPETVVDVGEFDLAPSITSTSEATAEALKSALHVRLVNGSSLEVVCDSSKSSDSDFYSLTLVMNASADAVEESSETDPEVLSASNTDRTERGTARTEHRTVTTTRTVAVQWEPGALYKTGAEE